MTFKEIYDLRPDKKNFGSFSEEGLKLLYDYAVKINPKYIVESGTWRGNGSWILSNACPKAEMTCYDLTFSNLAKKLDGVRYKEHDIKKDTYNRRGKSKWLMFFDDHVNQKQRLKWCIEHKFVHVIFDDNAGSDDINKFKNPPYPTLEILKERGELPGNIEVYERHDTINKKNSHLTYIKLKYD